MTNEEFIKECAKQMEKRKVLKSELFQQYKTATETERFTIGCQISKIDYEIGAINNLINELRRA